MFTILLLIAAFAIPPCWDIFDTALQHSAAAAHPAFVHYDEHILVTQDEQRLIQSSAQVDYRDDGLARVSDERFNFEPYVTASAEPGPPELGPYGRNRDTWLPPIDALPTIAHVRSQGDLKCDVAGVETYKGHTTYHLLFTDRRRDRPSLKGMWIDTASRVIWKVIVSGYVYFDEDAKSGPTLADFEVELQYAGPYLVVDHVVWAYSRREYSQESKYFAEYTLSGFSFPQSMPAAYFMQKTAASAAVSP
jgi:hypothetical protein